MGPEDLGWDRTELSGTKREATKKREEARYVRAPISAIRYNHEEDNSKQEEARTCDQIVPDGRRSESQYVPEETPTGARDPFQDISKKIPAATHQKNPIVRSCIVVNL